MKASEDRAKDLNLLIEFLARRDVHELSAQTLVKAIGAPQADLLILLGNSSLFVAEQAAKAYQAGLAKTFMISGGKGHSTHYLAENISRHKQYKSVATANRPEADMLQEVLVQHLGIKEANILLENKSTNCGANAMEAHHLLSDCRHIRSILLMQDPVLQQRTHWSFKKAWEKEEAVTFLSFAAFVPYVEAKGGALTFQDPASFDFCTMERFLALVGGEIPRLRDDAQGYGPKGRGFIPHVAIPDQVLSAWGRLRLFFEEFLKHRPMP